MNLVITKYKKSELWYCDSLFYIDFI